MTDPDPVLRRQLTDLLESLKEFNAATRPSQEIVPLYNHLLKAAKEQLPDESLVQTLEPARQHQGDCSMNAGSMRLAVRQVLAELPEATPEEMIEGLRKLGVVEDG